MNVTITAECHDHGRHSIIERSPLRNCRVLRRRETGPWHGSLWTRSFCTESRSCNFNLTNAVYAVLAFHDRQPNDPTIDARHALVADSGSWTVFHVRKHQ